MPQINSFLNIDITPERFVSACSDLELQELEILMHSNHVQSRLRAIRDPEPDVIELKGDEFNQEDF